MRTSRRPSPLKSPSIRKNMPVSAGIMAVTAMDTSALFENAPLRNDLTVRTQSTPLDTERFNHAAPGEHVRFHRHQDQLAGPITGEIADGSNGLFGANEYWKPAAIRTCVGVSGSCPSAPRKKRMMSVRGLGVPTAFQMTRSSRPSPSTSMRSLPAPPLRWPWPAPRVFSRCVRSRPSWQRSGHCPAGFGRIAGFGGRARDSRPSSMHPAPGAKKSRPGAAARGGQGATHPSARTTQPAPPRLPGSTSFVWFCRPSSRMSRANSRW